MEKKGIAQTWWVIATALVVVVVIVLALLWFRGGGDKAFDTIEDQIPTQDDGDSDGVPDWLDDCSGTPPNTNVDGEGCSDAQNAA